MIRILSCSSSFSFRSTLPLYNCAKISNVFFFSVSSFCFFKTLIYYILYIDVYVYVYVCFSFNIMLIAQILCNFLIQFATHTLHITFGFKNANLCKIKFKIQKDSGIFHWNYILYWKIQIIFWLFLANFHGNTQNSFICIKDKKKHASIFRRFRLIHC